MLDWYLDLSYIKHVPVYSTWFRVFMIFFMVIPLFPLIGVSMEEYSGNYADFICNMLTYLTGIMGLLEYFNGDDATKLNKTRFNMGIIFFLEDGP